MAKRIEDRRAHGRREHTCTICGAIGTRSDTPFCSKRCSYLATSPSSPIPYVPCSGKCGRVHIGGGSWHCRRCRALARSATIQSTGLLWVNGRCLRCGDQFTSYTTTNQIPSWCSIQCVRLDAKARARARRVGAVIERFARWKVFEDHGWICSICLDPIDPTITEVLHPRYPTLDHVVALGDVPPGRHAEDNLLPAHRVCNSLKGDDYLGSPF